MIKRTKNHINVRRIKGYVDLFDGESLIKTNITYYFEDGEIVRELEIDHEYHLLKKGSIGKLTKIVNGDIVCNFNDGTTLIFNGLSSLLSFWFDHEIEIYYKKVK